jgi:hypothetical protein
LRSLMVPLPPPSCGTDRDFHGFRATVSGEIGI